MKKILVLLLLACVAQVRSTVVQLTEIEKKLRDKITGRTAFTYLHNDIDKLLLSVLLRGCNISQNNPADEYDSDKQPDCQKTLEFLKAYAVRAKEQEREILRFYHTLSTDSILRPRGRP